MCKRPPLAAASRLVGLLLEATDSMSRAVAKQRGGRRATEKGDAPRREKGDAPRGTEKGDARDGAAAGQSQRRPQPERA